MAGQETEKFQPSKKAMKNLAKIDTINFLETLKINQSLAAPGKVLIQEKWLNLRTTNFVVF